jgi:mono/diheme cytochrome c family protein
MKKTLILAVLLAVAATTTALADGKAIYESGCAKCHGADGKGLP